VRGTSLVLAMAALSAPPLALAASPKGKPTPLTSVGAVSDPDAPPDPRAMGYESTSSTSTVSAPPS
jgi:hypothetical protein